MRKFSRLNLIVSLTLLAGCHSPRTSGRSPSHDIAAANESIDASRLVKRRVLLADPVERVVEHQINSNEQVASARFAIEAFNWSPINSNGISHDDPFYFSCVVVTKAALSEEHATQILTTAFEAAKINSQIYRVSTVGNTWVYTGSVQIHALDNPELSTPSR